MTGLVILLAPSCKSYNRHCSTDQSVVCVGYRSAITDFNVHLGTNYKYDDAFNDRFSVHYFLLYLAECHKWVYTFFCWLYCTPTLKMVARWRRSRLAAIISNTDALCGRRHTQTRAHNPFSGHFLQLSQNMIVFQPKTNHPRVCI